MVFPNASGAGAGSASAMDDAGPHASGGGACTAIAFRTGGDNWKHVCTEVACAELPCSFDW